MFVSCSLAVAVHRIRFYHRCSDFITVTQGHLAANGEYGKWGFACVLNSTVAPLLGFRAGAMLRHLATGGGGSGGPVGRPAATGGCRPGRRCRWANGHAEATGGVTARGFAAGCAVRTGRVRERAAWWSGGTMSVRRWLCGPRGRATGSLGRRGRHQGAGGAPPAGV